jgi:Ca2+-binding RTX toxin-like protein
MLTGQKGRDMLTGGDGADTFVFRKASDSATGRRNGIDTITDFSRAEGDHIDLSRFGNVDFVGRHRFSGDGDELRVITKNGDTIVQADLNGDGRTDFTLRLDDKIRLQEGDFIL